MTRPLDNPVPVDVAPLSASVATINYAPQAESISNGVLLSSTAHRMPSTQSISVQTGEYDPVPEQIGDYTILGVIDHGGMGVVYHARDLLGNDYALKMIRNRNLSATTIERFFSEAKAMSEVRHPNLAEIRHFGLHDERPYFVMKKYSGCLADCSDRFRDRRDRTIAVMTKIADAVAVLHAHGLVHRDLKPNNILLDGDEPIVADLGLVKSVMEAESPASQAPSEDVGVPGSGSGRGSTRDSGPYGDRTVVGAVLGTRAYMPPEQAAGRREVNPTWDTWALGVLLHELLLGERPDEFVLGDWRNGPTLKPGLDAPLEKIVRKCLTVRGEDRCANAGELASDLRSLQDRKRSVARAWQLAAASVLFIGLAIAALVAVANRPADQSAERPTTMEDRRNGLIEKLRYGKPVVIVGDTGQPDYSRLWEGEDDAHLRNWKTDGAFTIDSPTAALLEIVPPGACRDGFRIKAMVRNNHGHLNDGEAGIYYGHNVREETPGRRHYFAELTFAEYSTSRKKNDGFRNGLWTYGLRHFALAPTNPPSNSRSTRWDGPLQSRWPVLDEDESWRELTLEVTPEKTIVQWEQQSKQFDNTKLAAGFRNFLLGQRHTAAQPPLSFGPEMGCGFFVYQASVSFRSVTVEPLSPVERP